MIPRGIGDRSHRSHQADAYPLSGGRYWRRDDLRPIAWWMSRTAAPNLALNAVVARCCWRSDLRRRRALVTNVSERRGPSVRFATWYGRAKGSDAAFTSRACLRQARPVLPTDRAPPISRAGKLPLALGIAHGRASPRAEAIGLRYMWRSGSRAIILAGKAVLDRHLRSKGRSRCPKSVDGIPK